MESPLYTYGIQQVGERTRLLKTTNNTGGLGNNTFTTSVGFIQAPELESYEVRMMIPAIVTDGDGVVVVLTMAML